MLPRSRRFSSFHPSLRLDRELKDNAKPSGPTKIACYRFTSLENPRREGLNGIWHLVRRSDGNTLDSEATVRNFGIRKQRLLWRACYVPLSLRDVVKRRCRKNP